MKIKKNLLLFFVVFLLIKNLFVFAFSGFGFPTSSVGEKTGYITQGLGESKFAKGHLGEDYSMPFGVSVYSIADGEVFSVADWKGCPSHLSHGWGGVVIIKHRIPGNANQRFNTKNAILKGSPAIANPKTVYSMYGHLTNIKVKKGQKIKKGTKLGEIGKVCYKDKASRKDRIYGAHLHFEIKDQNSLKEWESIGRGYYGVNGYAPNRYIPSKFIENNKHLVAKENSIPSVEKAKSAINKIVKKVASKKPTKEKTEGAIIKESPLSFWEKISVYAGIIKSDFKQFLEGRKPKKTNNKRKKISSKGTKKEVWNQKFIWRSITRFTYISGEKKIINTATFRFKNTGNTLWKKQKVFLNVVGGYSGTAAKFYHKSWESRLRPATFKENIVEPGEIATFKFVFSYPLKDGTYYPQFTLSRYTGEKWIQIGKDKAVFIAKIKRQGSNLNYFSATVNRNIKKRSQRKSSNNYNNKKSSINDLEIKDLKAIAFSKKAILLFSSPEENFSYEIYFASEPFSNKNFQKKYRDGIVKKVSATKQDPHISSGPIRTKEGKIRIEIDSLKWFTKYFFAVRAKKNNQYSKLSNVVSFTTDSALAMSDFPMFHYNSQREGVVPFSGPGQNYKIKILIEGEKRGDYDYDYFSTPSVDSKGNIYLTGKYHGLKGFYSFTKEGSQRIFVPGDFSGMPLLFEAVNLAFAIKNNLLVAINIQNGKIVWEKVFSSISNDEFLAIDGYGRLYFTGGVCIKGEECLKKENGKSVLNIKEGIFSLNSKTGKVNWFFSVSDGKRYKESEIYFQETLSSLSDQFSPVAIDKGGNLYFGFKNILYVLSSEGNRMLQKDFSPSSCNQQQLQWNNTYVGSILIGNNSTIYVEVVGEKYEGCGSWSEGWRSCIHALNSESLESKWGPICASQYAYRTLAIDNEGNLYIAPAYYCASCGGFAYSYLSVFNSSGENIRNITLNVSGLPSEILIDLEKNVYALFSGVYSNPLIILPNGSTIPLQPNLQTSYPYYSDSHISISRNGTLYLGTRLRLYAIEPKED